VVSVASFVIAVGKVLADNGQSETLQNVGDAIESAG
jgi:hypothetical protein